VIVDGSAPGLGQRGVTEKVTRVAGQPAPVEMAAPGLGFIIVPAGAVPLLRVTSLMFIGVPPVVDKEESKIRAFRCCRARDRGAMPTTVTARGCPETR